MSICLFCLVNCMSMKSCPALHVPESNAVNPRSIPLDWALNCFAGCSEWPPHPSSLVEFSSREEMVVRLWEAVIVATVWSRTRTSRQSLSLLLHSLEAADEVRDVPCWQDGWVLLRVPLELLSGLLSHRTSQHAASASEGLSSKSPDTQNTSLEHSLRP